MRETQMFAHPRRVKCVDCLFECLDEIPGGSVGPAYAKSDTVYDLGSIQGSQMFEGVIRQNIRLRGVSVVGPECLGFDFDDVDTGTGLEQRLEPGDIRDSYTKFS